MPWSIYAYLPLIWLGAIIFYGLIRASYEVGLETLDVLSPEIPGPIIKEKEYEVVGLRRVGEVSELLMRTETMPMGDIIADVHRDLAYQLLEQVKTRIRFFRTKSIATGRLRIEASLYVAERKN